ncbi:MAG: alpha/beta fold hydrolase [Gammaproteobacteria bacterium]|nr:alpha/beta fold hydrolase [Gammaproteobacteria bacterium]MBQ0775647.1 alpha/beta fold hydrolase [Gammaproteobacteria bacterium]
MICRRPILVTGATGFLGSHFVTEYLRNFSGDVRCIVRGSSEGIARAKLAASLEKAASASMERFDQEDSVSVICGDLEQSECGVKDVQKDVKEFWHFAASLEFDADRSEHIEKQNVEGVKNAIDLALRAGVERFIYVSTAYTCGHAVDVIPESLHDEDGPFNNFYEETKCRAEHLVQKLCKESGLSITILRPSIVIGHSETFRTGGSETGLYGFIRDLSMLAPSLKAAKARVRIHGNPDTVPNFVPVDYLIKDLLSLISASSVEDGIFHLSSDGGVSSSTAVRVICEQLGIENLTVEQVDDLSASPIEKLLIGKTKFYSAYLSEQKIFSRKIKSKNSVSESDFRAYVIEGIKSLEGFSVNQFFSRDILRTKDDVLLNVYSHGEHAGSEAVVIVNAFGMPVDFLVPLSRKLSLVHNVVTWESRGVPSRPENGSEMMCSLEEHVSDMREVMDRRGVTKCHVIGWCTGATVALRFASEFGDRVSSVSLLNGGYNLCGAEQTAFQENMRNIMPLIAGDRDQAEFFFKTIFESMDIADVGGEYVASSTLDKILASTNPRHAHLTSFPFRNSDLLYNYARLISSFIEETIEGDIVRVGSPCLVATGLKDVTASPESSIFLSDYLPDAQLYVDAEGDHFMLHDNTQLHDKVQNFISEVTA